jgi:hypothetical protein
MGNLSKLDLTLLACIADVPERPTIEYVELILKAEPFLKLGRTTLYDRVKFLSEEKGLIQIDYEERKFRRLTLTPAGLAAIGKASPSEEVRTS